MKYKILVDYGSEGRSFIGSDDREGKEFDTVDEAIKFAIGYTTSSHFDIVQVIDWEAKEKD
jgi:hypothetical protein